ncbi:hypothetical protein [Nannocystis bainbridge]|uniref:Lipoprotein n=1 Tax=Nannocystis bainbridge TaxID=2995303 RepID=A0ABT5E669_9BACT|nr:hypothetical protein [Nannocystis bainbridge]MDC0721349.1 hypothetical protein [Nannocystis bainbridge]
MTRTTAPQAVATALALAGCSAGEQRREVDAAPAKIDGRQAARQGDLLSGSWAPLPGRIVDIAATDDMLFLADVPEAGHPMRVHAGRWRDGQWRWEQPWSVPWPPTVPAGHDLTGSGAWLGVAATSGGAHVSLTRVEYQGGSHGIAVATLVDGAWTNTTELESPTDADIAFGRPALRRGDVLLTADGHDRLWHYTRANDDWQGQPIALPAGSTLMLEPAMDLSADAADLAVAYQDAADKPALALYRRGPAGGYALAGTRALPGPVTALAFAGAELFLGFQRPTPDGAVVWALPAALPDPLVPARRLELPAPADPKHEHLSDGDVSPDWVLALQLDAAWVRDAAAAGPLRRLDLPPAKDGKLRRPAGALMGSVAVLLVDGRLGSFALE